MKCADLHVHTFYSDSTFSPEEVMACAADKKLSAIAICDHDSIGGIGPCESLSGETGVEVIPGIEMTAEKVDAEIHLLGYCIDWKAAWFVKRLKEIQKARIARIHVMVEKLNEAGINVKAEEIFNLAGRGTVGRLHVAQAMMKTGKLRSYKEIFEKYIGFQKSCYVPYVKFSPKEAIEAILKVGGVPVIAHPALMGNDDYIPELVDYGLRGIEVYHTDHKQAARMRYEEMARRYGLLMTGGSDCHGLGKGRVLMGSVRVPYMLVEKLKEEADSIKRSNR
jgi:predicted metal-dependent phosphoesterase TrpH